MHALCESLTPICTPYKLARTAQTIVRPARQIKAL